MRGHERQFNCFQESGQKLAEKSSFKIEIKGRFFIKTNFKA